MPWVNEEMCIGCGTCVDECPVAAITMIEDIATIDNDECIRCGTCHDICPQEAVRHDGELIPQEIEDNVAWVKRLLDHYHTAEERQQFLERIKRHFGKQKKVAEGTLTRVEALHKGGA